MSNMISIKNLKKSFYIKKNFFSEVEDFLEINKEKKIEILNINNLEINKNDKIILVGPNGSGKSTLLKILSGLMMIDEGEIKISEKNNISHILNLDFGFLDYLSGRENVINYLKLKGYNKDFHKILEDILEFSEIEKVYFNQPFFSYSSGMKLRLIYSCTLIDQKDLIFLDEIIGVGDFSFNKKCFKYLNETSKNRTVLLATHNFSDLIKFFNRMIFLEKGKIIFDGNLSVGKKFFEEYWSINSNSTIDNIDQNQENYKINFNDKEILISSKNIQKMNKNYFPDISISFDNVENGNIKINFNINYKKKSFQEDLLFILDIKQGYDDIKFRLIIDFKKEYNFKNLSETVDLSSGKYLINLMIAKKNWINSNSEYFLNNEDVKIFLDDFIKFDVKNKKIPFSLNSGVTKLINE